MTRERLDRLATLVEQWLPPVLRDSVWFSKLLLKLSVRHNTGLFMTFKDIAPSLTPQQLADRFYSQVKQTHRTDATDLSRACLHRVLHNLVGRSVLEVGCGRGYLAQKIASLGDYRVTATDIVIDNVQVSPAPNLKCIQANMHALPFKDKSFDTVVTTHTLEHVLDLHQAMGELRRVAKKRLIIVVPKERPYRYPPNFHLHFFPYPHSLIIAIGYRSPSLCQAIGRELYYQEDR